MLEIDKEILKGYIDTIILSLLRHKSMYGYELAKMVREKTNSEFELKEATMYIALKRLEKRKLIDAYWGEDGQSGGGRRRYYKISMEGNQFYDYKKEEWKLIKNILKNFFEEE